MNNDIKEFNEELYVEMLENGELYDYITNLQQENKELNNSITWWNNRYNALQRDYEDYKSRCEKANEITKDLKQFVYDELVDRNVGGATETYNKIINLLNTLNGRSDEK